MAKIQKSSIESVLSNSVKVSYTIEKEEENVNLPPTSLNQKKREETLKTVSITGGFSSSASTTASTSGIVTGYYDRTVPTSHTLTTTPIVITLSYVYTEYNSVTYEQNFYKYASTPNVQIASNYLGQTIPLSNGQYCVLQFGGTELINDVIHYIINAHPIYWEKNPYKTNVSATATSNTGSYYKRPSSFTFNNCSSGKQWQVDLGLQSLITNIYDFPYYATHWKAWKNQSATGGSCPNFSKGDLTASNLNSIYYYVKGTNPYSAGDEVAASMFNDLASAINGG